MAKPFIKWVGGKRQLLPTLLDNLPIRFNRYFEPFIGGGAMFFAIKPKDAFLSDINNELINLYNVVKNSVFELIDEISLYKYDCQYFYQIRNLDRDKENYNKLSDIQKAGRFIYLNKSCFNGLYRVNSNGEFNVPFGKYKNPTILDKENLLETHHILKNANIESYDFEIIKDNIKVNDFIYLDPPYIPLNTTANFTSYTKDGFDIKMQERLKTFCEFIDKKGAYFMLSNSYTDITLDLYNGFNIATILANRSINSNGTKRGKINEVLISNYKGKIWD